MVPPPLASRRGFGAEWQSLRTAAQNRQQPTDAVYSKGNPHATNSSPCDGAPASVRPHAAVLMDDRPLAQAIEGGAPAARRDSGLADFWTPAMHQQW
jgi:hypothetical protein